MISGGAFDLPGKESRLQEIKNDIQSPLLWNDPKSASLLLKEQKGVENSLSQAKALKSKLADAETLLELSKEGEDVGNDIIEIIKAIEAELESMEVQVYLSDPLDSSNAILSIHPGAGGTESQDWANMLLRMYLRYSEREGFKTEIMDYQNGDTAGIKSATVLIRGSFAYGLLRPENGVHRLVRISPFDSNARRHTSFSSVFVYPEVDESINIEIDEKDVRIDTYRAGGHGGQNVNKVSSAVRLTHIPSGLVVTCQNERSQHKNRDFAWKILKARLYQLEQEKRAKEKQAIEDTKKDIAWGNQIRSYVLHPYHLVKDHRTNMETGNSDDVLDGNLTPFIRAFLKESAMQDAK